MAEKVVKVPAALLVVTTTMEVVDAKKKKKGGRFPLQQSTDGVLKWALFGAFCIAGGLCFGAAVAIFTVDVASSSSSSSPNIPISSPGGDEDGVQLTPAQDAELLFFTKAMLVLTVPQAAAAKVGLLLPHSHGRSRRSLATVAIAASAVAHYFYVRNVLISLAAHGGDTFFTIAGVAGSVIFVAGDLLNFISLLLILLMGGEDQ